MNLFGKPDAVDNDTDKWKSKYLHLLDEQELDQKAHQDEQELLCKTIVRLALATKGLDKQLDPHLVKIRNQLKSGLKHEQLKMVLDDFSNALLQFEDSHNQPKLDDASLLFKFLLQLFPKQKLSLQLIQNKYDQLEFTSSQELLIALFDALEISFGKPQEASNEAIGEASGSSDDIDTKDIILQFQQILNTLDIPPEFENVVLSLKNRFKQCESFDVLKVIMNDYFDLLQAVKKFHQSEQKEMAVFLSNLTEQLNDLGLKATGASVATQIAAKKRNLLDESVSAQMVDLQKSSENATSLEPLKQLINTRLQNIAHEIKEHAKQEEQQRLETEKQLTDLAQKITDLDAESKELKNKLLIAHSKATRDPLTGLPNRLAYEENVAIEISRWKRYLAPLTMVIWDIDFFKKINDTYGHKAGDKTLVIIANILSQYCRGTDFVARVGGEEFIMLIPNTDGPSTLNLANKIRSIIENTGFNSGGNRIKITLSCGISEFKTGDNSESVFERADKALYQAKEKGRNQCVLN